MPPPAHTHTHTQSGKSASTGSTPTGYSEIHLLKHGTHAGDKNKDVTTLEWSPTGLLLATGSYDGVARVWDRAGKLVFTLQQHKGPIFSLKWNKRGNYILSGSYDKTTIVWDAVTGSIKQMFEIHSQPALDVDWRDDDIFASCSTDKRVVVCKVGGGTNYALEVFSGHVDEVNAVKWDPSGTLLASCSDDGTAKIWKPTKLKLGVGAADSVSDSVSDNVSDSVSATTAPAQHTTTPTPPFLNLTLHKKEIYTIKWSPCGPGSANPSSPLLLATASFDATVRLWEVQNGSCLRVLSRHTDPVYSVSFSPNGKYLASGSLAGKLYVWDVAKGDLKRSYTGKGDIFEVAWNVEQTRVAACYSTNVITVVDFDANVNVGGEKETNKRKFTNSNSNSAEKKKGKEKEKVKVEEKVKEKEKEKVKVNSPAKPPQDTNTSLMEVEKVYTNSNNSDSSKVAGGGGAKGGGKVDDTKMDI